MNPKPSNIVVLEYVGKYTNLEILLFRQIYRLSDDLVFFRKFGITEVDDTLAFLSKLRQYHYIDDARIAIWGWSYGGMV